jgi:hypothetical protein
MTTPTTGVPALSKAGARLYRPRKTILDGTWTFPEAKPLA